jgi:transposase
MGRIIGIDLGDQKSHYCVLDEHGTVVEEGSVRTAPEAFAKQFGLLEASLVAVEVGIHSRWASRVLRDCGHEVIVANPVRLRLIHQSSRKSDRVDAGALARLVRVDPELLGPVEHRREEDQNMLSVLRVRDVLVRSRTRLINCARGLVKPTGARIPSCAASSFASYAHRTVPAELRMALDPLIEQIRGLAEQIRHYDRQIEKIATTKYPETLVLQQVKGVGALTALGFVLTLGRSDRFAHSRDVGAYIGLRPRRYQSGESNPQLGISKEGDAFVRRLLVNSAQYILRPFGPDTDLRRWGESLIARGGRGAKRRAVVAVARKLSVLLHKLWVTREDYKPFRNSRNQQGIRQLASAQRFLEGCRPSKPDTGDCDSAQAYRRKMILKAAVKIAVLARITTCTGPHGSTESANGRLAGSAINGAKGAFFFAGKSGLRVAQNPPKARSAAQQTRALDRTCATYEGFTCQQKEK